MIKYTFLLPAYKSSFLGEALISIKNQTYKDFRVLVSDDCSPENLKSIFDDICGNDERFSFRRNEVNMGGQSLVSHWNMLVDLCDTEYLIMASDDDIYEPAFLQEIDDLVKKYPLINVLRAKAKRIEDNTVSEIDNDIPEYLSQEEFLPYFGLKPMVHCLANYVFRTSELKSKGYFPDFPKAGYSDSAAAMLLSNNGIATTHNVLFTFRISKENLSSTNGYQKYSEEGIRACVMFADWYKNTIKPFVHYKGDIKVAHMHHVLDVAQFFLCRMTFVKMMYYYFMLLYRGYFNIRSTLTMFKNYKNVR